jgi:hypothetical protein
MTLGPCAVGDDPKPRTGAMQGADRGDPEKRIGGAPVRREDQLDDGDVEVADGADHLQRVLAVGRLLDLVAV